jgi:hypothetical protein
MGYPNTRLQKQLSEGSCKRLACGYFDKKKLSSRIHFQEYICSVWSLAQINTTVVKAQCLHQKYKLFRNIIWNFVLTPSRQDIKPPVKFGLRYVRCYTRCKHSLPKNINTHITTFFNPFLNDDRRMPDLIKEAQVVLGQRPGFGQLAARRRKGLINAIAGKPLPKGSDLLRVIRHECDGDR